MTITITVSSVEELESFAAAVLRQGGRLSDTSKSKPTTTEKSKADPPVTTEKVQSAPDQAEQPASVPVPDKKEPKQARKEKPAPAPADPVPAAESATTEEPASAPAPEAAAGQTAVTLIDLRRMMKTCMDSGHHDELTALLKTFGASKLSQVSADKWPELAEGLARIGG
jgi:outer membrane biosynthesis protein TonB